MNSDSTTEMREREIGEVQAAELRTRLKSFAEDWERPEADIYDRLPLRKQLSSAPAGA
ncbi:MAG TPA: hypothetical protein VMF08_20870 [Candidatus Sulfotelmatobacter sp.]|nr:hypothetical protein [Candidatus Sulfotelmatobacter sp.]